MGKWGNFEILQSGIDEWDKRGIGNGVMDKGEKRNRKRSKNNVNLSLLI
jgi:hypothetical protein